MKEWLKKQMKKKEEQRAALKQRGDASDNVAEVRSILTQIQELDTEIAELRQQIESLPDEPVAGGATPTTETRGQQSGAQTPGVPPIAVASFNTTQEQRQEEPEDRFNTVEYRKAFMEFAKTGKLAPEYRADAYSGTTDLSAVIPTTILNEVVQVLKTYGQLFSRVRKLNIEGGVQVPIVSLKPSASWIGESASSDRQKIKANTNVSFNYYGLECKVATSLLAKTVTLPEFESTIASLIAEAMMKALDAAIISADGSGKMLGIIEDDRVPVGQIITLSSSDFGSWDAWKKKVFAKIPLSYRAGGSWIMAAGTFEGHIDGMVDANGQPVGRVNYGIANGPQERFGGREVILVEDDIIAPYDSAAKDEVVAVFCKLSDYAINSNLQMQMYRWLDHDTNQWVDKALLIADGKLLDPNGVVIVKKGA